VLRVEREILITAGGIGSPKLMLLSGMGPADELKALGIKVEADLPGVGRNLHDHYSFGNVCELTGPYGFDKYQKLHWKLWAGMEYALFKKGPVASNLFEGGAFWYADKSASTPDLQFHFLLGTDVAAGVGGVPSGSGATLHSYPLRPRARGFVRLRSKDSLDPPIVDPNFLGDEYDLRVSVEGIKISREILKQLPLAKFVHREHFPGHQVQTQVELENYARQYGVSASHQVGACRMGNDIDAVVDPQLRVRHVEGLRICDSSIMPRLVSSNTNAPSIMIGEKASDLILGNQVERAV
jgi:choline dehydrogenase